MTNYPSAIIAIFLFALGGFFSPLTGAADETAKENAAAEKDPCQELVLTIRTDVNKYNRDIKNQDLPWMKLSWLQAKLGTNVKLSPVLQTLYQWENFSLITGGKASKAAGKFPGKTTLGSPTYEQATDVLGKPNNVETEILNKVSWNCTNNSRIEAITDDSGNILEISGTDCSNPKTSGSAAPPEQENKIVLGCIDFNASIKPSKLEQKISTIVTPGEEKANINPVMMDMMRDYNMHYKTNIQDTMELQVDMSKRLIDFYRDLRSCNAGVYLYSIPTATTVVYYKSTINGLINNLCSTETSFITPDGSTHLIQCQYLKSTLKLFTDEYADSLSHGNIESTSDSLKSAQASQCQTFINGKEIKENIQIDVPFTE